MLQLKQRMVWGLGLAALLCANGAVAASWQDKLNGAVEQLNGQNGGSQSSQSASSITSLLNGGDRAVSASSMTNAAGIMQYCLQNNLVKNNVAPVKERMLDKLGLNSSEAQQQKPDYQQGVMGLLNTGDGQRLNLQSLSNTPMGEKLKTKACNVVLKQGKNFIS